MCQLESAAPSHLRGTAAIVKPDPLSPRPRAHRALLLSLIAGICAPLVHAKQPNYQLQLAAPAASTSGIDPRLSINTTGSVAFAGTDASDSFSKVFVSNCPPPPPLLLGASPLTPCPNATVVSFFGANRLFSGADINDASPPGILSEDRVSGSPPVWLLRSWQDAAPYPFLLAGESPTTFGFATPFFGLANNGDAVVVVGVGSALNPAVQYIPASTNGPVPVRESQLAELLFSSGAILRPQIAKDANITVINNNFQNQTLTYDKTLTVPTSIAGAFNGYTALGSSPGISDDGLVVAFAATQSSSSGIHVSVKVPLAIPLVGSTSFLTPVVQVGKDGVSDLSASQTNRIPVLSRVGASFNSPNRSNQHYHLLTVAFSGTVAIGTGPALPGIYSRDVLLRVFYPPTGQPNVSVAALSRISKMAAAGDIVDGTMLSTNFGLADAGALLTTGSVATANADEQSPLFVVSATSSAAQTVAVRARRVCSVPSAVSYDQKQVNFPGVTLSGGQGSIAAKGCQLTTVTNIANYYTSVGLKPSDSNLILANHGFFRTGNGFCFPATQQCPIGPPQYLGFNGIPNGDVSLRGAIALSAIFGAPATSGFWVDVATNFDTTGHAPSGNFPLVPNVNSNPLEPVADFFLCNQEPIEIRVPNCSGATCSQHFVLARGKDVTGGNATEDINDPGYANNPPTNLYGQFTNGRTRQNTVIGIRAITAASLPGASAAGGGLRIQINSPVSVVVTDPAGRQFGYDPVAAQSYADIDNAEITDDSFSDPDGLTLQSDAKVLEIGGPSDAYGNTSGTGSGVLDGQYTLAVIGTGTGPYTLSIQSTDAAGNTRTRYVAGTTTPGQRDTVFVQRSSATGATLTLTTASVPVRLAGDILLHGRVNIDDVQAITRAIGTQADGADDPMDLNHDGQITALDARLDVLLCTKPGCAR